MKQKKQPPAANGRPIKKASKPSTHAIQPTGIAATDHLRQFPSIGEAAIDAAADTLAEIFDHPRIREYGTRGRLYACRLAAVWAYCKLALEIGEDPFAIAEWVSHLAERAPCPMDLTLLDAWRVIHDVMIDFRRGRLTVH